MGDARFSDDFWNDPIVKQLAPLDRYLFIYFFTNPHRNWCGLYHIKKIYIQSETGLNNRAIDTGMDTLAKSQLISFSEDYEIVFVHSMLKRQCGGQEYLNWKQKKGIVNQLKTLHNCPLIGEFLKKYAHYEIPYEYTPIDTPMDIKYKYKYKPKPKPNIKGSQKSQAGNSKTPFPEDFAITDDIKTWAKAHGFSHLEEHLEWMKDWAKSRNKLYSDWQAAFRNAIRGNWGKIDYTKPEKRPEKPKIEKLCKCGSGKFASKCCER